MHLRQLPYDQPAPPPPPPRPAEKGIDGYLFANVCWMIVILCMIVGAAT